VRERDATETVSADYFAEELRRELIARFGEDALYRGGLSARSTVDPGLQAIAERALHDGQVAYDQRHGWRGPIAQIDIGDDWRAALAEVTPPAGLRDWHLAVVLEAGAETARLGLDDGT